MIKIYIGKRDYKHTLKVVLKFIKNESSRAFTYSTDIDADDADVYVNATMLCSRGYIQKHSEELPKDTFVYIEKDIGIYVKGEIVSIDVLEDYMERM